MTRRGVIGSVAVLGLASILSTGWLTAWAVPPSTTVVETDNHGRVQVARGGTLVVRLDALPGTGYGWEVATLNREILEPAGPPTLESTRTSQPGALEQQVFEFRTLRAGSSALELYYRRPWEKDVPPQKVFRVMVEVR